MDEPEGTTPENEATPAEQEATPAGWGGPSEEEWKTVVGGLHYLSQQLQQGGDTEPQPEEPDYENMDVGEIVSHYVDGRISELEPYVATAAREAGNRRMNELFDSFEKDPEIGKFDRQLAGRVAEALYGENGDPVASVREAAKLVSGMSKAERAAGAEEYKKSLSRSNFSDPAVSGGGERAPMDAKTYDEVIARWSGQDDV